jgi:hypothetical protein
VHDDVVERLQDVPVVASQGRGPRLRQLFGPELGTERQEFARRPGVVPERLLERGVAFAHRAEW